MGRKSTAQQFEWLEAGRAKFIVSQAIVAAGDLGISMSLSKEGIEHNNSILKDSGISPSLQDATVRNLWTAGLGTVNNDGVMKFTKKVRDLAQGYVDSHPEYTRKQAFHLYEMEVSPKELPGFYDGQDVEKRHLRHIMIVEDNPFSISGIAACKDVDFLESLGLSKDVIEGMDKESGKLALNIQNVLGESPIAYHLSHQEMIDMFKALPELALTIELVNLPPSEEKVAELTANKSLDDYITYVNDEAKQTAKDMGAHVERTRQLLRERRSAPIPT